MKRLLITLLLLVTPPLLAAQQVSRYDNIAIGNVPGGQLLQALPNAMITVQGCASMQTSCTLPANLCSSITDTGCGLPGLLYADSGGNYHFYARAGRYQITITASGFQARTMNDVILPLSASDGGSSGGGTSVTVNGTAAVPNALNFSNILLPPTNGTVINFLLNGNNTGAYLPGNGNAANCLSGTGTWVACGGGGGGAGFTVNGTTPSGTVNFNASNPLPPPNGINVNWTLVGTNLTAAIVGDGNPNSCLIGTGIFAACPGGGGGGGTPLPTIPQYNLYASNGAGGAQDSGTKAGLPGFLETEVLLATGDVTSQAAPFQLFPNASVEYFPTGYVWSGGTVGAAHGFAGYFSHSAGTTASTNGGIGLGGGNSGGTGNQIYLDCETSGCDFKVPVTYLGTGIGGGGGGSGTVGSGTGGFFTWYASTGTAVTSNAHLDDGATTPATITSQETIAAPGINVTGSGGIAMTGAGATLPTPAAGQGGIGIGPGNVPEYYSNGGAWTAIGSGGAGGGTAVSINGTSAGSALNITGTAPLGFTLAGGTATASITGTGSASDCLLGTGAFGACPTGGAGTLSNPIVFPGATLSNPAAGSGGFGVMGTGTPAMSINGSTFLPILSPRVNGSGITPGPSNPYFNFNATTPAAPANGINLVWQAASGTGSISAYLPTSGVATDCLHGNATWSTCASGGASGTVGSGTQGQFAWYSTTGTGVVGSANLTDTGALINSAEPVTAPSFVLPANGEVQGAGGSPAPSGTLGSFGILSGGYPAFSQAGGAFYAFKVTQVGGTALPATNTSINFGSTTAPTNGYSITFAAAGTAPNSLISAALIGNGTATTCLSGIGTYVSCGGSGTVSTGTVGALAYYPAASASVSPTTLAAVTSNGISMGTSILQFGTSSFTTMDGGIARLAANLIGVNSGTTTGESGYIRSANSCVITTDTAFSATNGTICTKSLPASQRNWAIHCAVPWNFTGGTGNGVVNLGVTLPALQNSSYFSTILASPSGGVFGTQQITAAGNVVLITTTSLVVTDPTMYTAYLDGVISVTATGGSVTFYMNTTNGNGLIRAGAYCRLD